MKFADGFWLNRRGYDVAYATSAYEVTKTNNSVIVLATSSPIYNRGCTLGGVTFEIVYTAVADDIIKVTIQHFKGGLKNEPKFELNEDLNYVPQIAITEEFAKLTAGNTSVTIRRGMEWNVEYAYKEKRLTGGGWRSTSYVQESKFLTENHKQAQMDDTFWTAPAGNGTYMREQLTLGVGECIYGFGEKFTTFVKNGSTVETWNADGGTCCDQSYKSIPFYISSNGYGVFVNSSGNVSYEVASDTVNKVSFTLPGEKLEYFIIGGENLKEVLKNYTGLTGRPALPPAETFGLWLSTSFTTTYDEKTVNSFIDGMRERDIPLQMFHFDCFWMKEFEWTNFEWDLRQFPDPREMMKRLHEKNLHLCAWINPYIAQRSKLFDEGVENDYFICNPDGSVFQTDMWQPGMAIVDFTNPSACEWFAGKIKELCSMGIDTIKTDFGERIPTNVVYSDGSDPVAMHNYYTYLYNKTVFEALEEVKGKNHACLFARSATVGGQKFPVHWGGDCSAEYSSMAETLRGGLSLCSSGFGFFSHDIGGFEQTASPDVYKRWCAFGLLSTHSRLHGSTSYRVPWAYEEDTPENPENACAVLRYFAKLKGRLMPYLFAQANLTHETGIPMMRAMVIEYPEDPVAKHLDQQYMLGDDLLVAPVFRADGVSEFYLPEGTWTDIQTGDTLEGGRYYKRTCNFLQMPMYARPNSIIGFGKFEGDCVYDYVQDTEFRIYGLEDGNTATAKIYDKDAKCVMTLTATRKGNEITITYDKVNALFTVSCGEKSTICKGIVGQSTLLV